MKINNFVISIKYANKKAIINNFLYHTSIPLQPLSVYDGFRLGKQAEKIDYCHGELNPTIIYY